MCQKAMISACANLGKPSIITRVVDTMIKTPRPTRYGRRMGRPGSDLIGRRMAEWPRSWPHEERGSSWARSELMRS